ncbi:MAG: hypothetical protein PGN29_14825 [Gordonia paraffinivorans]
MTPLVPDDSLYMYSPRKSREPGLSRRTWSSTAADVTLRSVAQRSKRSDNHGFVVVGRSSTRGSGGTSA